MTSNYDTPADVLTGIGNALIKLAECSPDLTDQQAAVAKQLGMIVGQEGEFQRRAKTSGDLRDARIWTTDLVQAQIEEGLHS